jgi:hypothetical protein
MSACRAHDPITNEEPTRYFVFEAGSQRPKRVLYEMTTALVAGLYRRQISSKPIAAFFRNWNMCLPFIS